MKKEKTFLYWSPIISSFDVQCYNHLVCGNNTYIHTRFSMSTDVVVIYFPLEHKKNGNRIEICGDQRKASNDRIRCLCARSVVCFVGVGVFCGFRFSILMQDSLLLCWWEASSG